MNILTFSTLFPTGHQPGWGKFVERQTVGLAQAQDVQLKVVNPIGMPPWPLRQLSAYRARLALPLRENRNGLDVYRPRFTLLPGIGWRFNPGAIVRAARPVLAGLLRDGFAIDVIDAEFFYPCGVAAARLGRELGIAVSIKARGSDIHYWGQRPAARAMMLAAADSAAGMLAVSGALKADMAALGMEEAKISVHYTGVDLDRFAIMDRAAARARVGLPVNPGGPLLVSVGALIPLKGHDIALRALALMPDVHLAIAGTGPEQSTLASLADTLGVARRVRFLGQVAHGDIPALLNAGDAMLLCSQREGLANAWVEALACGTPLVISDVGGAREVVGDAAAGQILSARTAQAVQDAVMALQAAAPEREATRAQALPFSWDANSAGLRAHLQACTAALRA